MSVPSRMDAVAGEGLERRWFEAGARRLAIDVPTRPASDDAATSAFRDAVLLDEHGVLLDCLADCLIADGALDWRPRPPRADTPDGPDGPDGSTVESPGDAIALTLVEADPAGGGRRIGLGASGGRAALDTRSLRSRHARWAPRVAAYPHRLSAELLLERLSLEAADLARVGEGSVVLLPSTFGAERTLTARAVGANALARRSGADESSSCELVLGERFDVAAEALEAVAESPVTFDVSLALDDASLARASDGAFGTGRSLVGRRGELQRIDGGLAVGELVALGSGLALVVDGVERWT